MAPTAVTRMINLTVIKYVSHLLGSRWFDFAAFVHLSPLLAPVLLLFPLHNSHTHRGGGGGGGGRDGGGGAGREPAGGVTLVHESMYIFTEATHT